MGPFNLKICLFLQIWDIFFFLNPQPSPPFSVVSVTPVIQMLQCLDPFFPSHHFSFYLLFSSIHSAVYQLISSFLFSVFKGFFNIPGSFMEHFVLWGFFWIYYALEF